MSDPTARARPFESVPDRLGSGARESLCEFFFITSYSSDVSYAFLSRATTGDLSMVCISMQEAVFSCIHLPPRKGFPIVTAAVIGASGFAGAELLRLLAGHPEVEVISAAGGTAAGTPVAELYPPLSALGYSDFDAASVALASNADVLITSVPHGQSASLIEEGGWNKNVIDVGADFRFIENWAYGLPELGREALGGRLRIANPGCYPTAALLALAPAISHGLVDPTAIDVFAISGISGAGRAAGDTMGFTSVNEGLKAYGAPTHSHTAEIAAAVERLSGTPSKVTFIPHLAPITRGLVATATAQLAGNLDQTAAVDAYDSYFKDEPFVHFVPTRFPDSRWLTGSNGAEVSVRVDERSGRLIAFCALDNLGKGAAGQAVQNLNLMFGMQETLGLTTYGLPI